MRLSDVNRDDVRDKDDERREVPNGYSAVMRNARLRPNKTPQIV